MQHDSKDYRASEDDRHADATPSITAQHSDIVTYLYV